MRRLDRCLIFGSTWKKRDDDQIFKNELTSVSPEHAGDTLMLRGASSRAGFGRNGHPDGTKYEKTEVNEYGKHP